MPYDEYATLHVAIDAGVAHVTIDNPPINALDARLMADLGRFAATVGDDKGVSVIVLQSANPEFFSAHADFDFMFDPESLAELALEDGDPSLNPLQQMNERFRRLPQVTIAKLAGRARAGGAELAMAAAAVEAVDAAEASGPVPRLGEQSTSHGKVYPSPEAVVDRVRAAMEAGAQTREGELDLEALLDRVS